MASIIEKEIDSVVGLILDDYNLGRPTASPEARYIDKMELFAKPERDIIIDMVCKLRRILFPGYFRDKSYRLYSISHNLSALIGDVIYNLNKQICIALRFNPKYENADETEIEAAAQRISLDFFRKIPSIRQALELDLDAAYDGDPAASSKEEIVFAYPGLTAITISRLAHELYLLGVPLIPRIMTEYAHSLTGIDIHPGASLGRYFFIDHGTGIVIGETTEIGDNVKIYQGVTLGALSTRGGQSLRGKKRHPTIEDNVTIYSGASVFGGETVIGEGTIIGSNAFIVSSVAPGSRVCV
ncbi:MAG: serine acetyltransferase [Firmicutes bacterium]|nr:serine acetyltransferase [Bacillota bacterium]